jgi:hypothetical protein
MTMSLKHTTCVLAIATTLYSGIVLGQEVRPVAVTPRQSGTSLAQERPQTSVAFRESIRREIARQQLAQASQQQPPAKEKSWAARHEKGLLAAVIAGAAFLILLAYAHHTCAGDEC